MDKNKALKLALEALEKISRTRYHIETPPIESLEEQMRCIADKAITAIKQAFEAPMQEPEIVQRVNTSTDYDPVGFPIYITPPATQRPWVGLTDEEIIDVIHPLVMADMPDEATDYDIARAIEAKLRGKNT